MRYFGAGSAGAAPLVQSSTAPVASSVSTTLASPAPIPTLSAASSVVATETTAVTAVDQSQTMAINAVFIPDPTAWRQASSTHPIDTLVGRTVYTVVGVYSDGNIGAVLLTSTPVP